MNIKSFFENLMKNGYRLEDKCLRNEFLILDVAETRALAAAIAAPPRVTEVYRPVRQSLDPNSSFLFEFRKKYKRDKFLFFTSFILILFYSQSQ